MVRTNPVKGNPKNIIDGLEESLPAMRQSNQEYDAYNYYLTNLVTSSL